MIGLESPNDEEGHMGICLGLFRTLFHSAAQQQRSAAQQSVGCDGMGWNL